MRLTIRRKLFLAFLGVVAVPVAMLGSLARSYMKTARGELDRRFVEESTATLKGLRDDMYGGIGPLQDATRRLAYERAVRDPSARLPIAPLAERFLREHPEAIGIKIEGRIEAPPAPTSELHHKLVERVRTALERMGKDQSNSLAALGEALRRLAVEQKQPSAPPKPEAELEKLLGEHVNAIVVEVQSASAATIFDNLRDESQSTRDHLRLAMEDFLRRGRTNLGVREPVWFAEPDGRGRVFLQEPVHDSRGEVEGMVFVEVDPRRWVHPKRLLGHGWAFLVEEKDGRLLPHHTPEESEPVAPLVPPLELLRSLEQTKRLTASYSTAGTMYHLYAVTSPEMLWVAVAPENEVYARLFWFRLQVFVVIAVSMLLAVWLAYFYSGRFVGAVEQIKEGVHAISRGEWAQLEKSSRDELGGELVESVNRMAMTLAERTRREEVATWRRLVRVLSHEINNTLGPVGSVAATIRDRIAPRVSDADAAEDLKMASRLIAERVGALSEFIAGYADLAKLPDPEREKVDFNKLVASAAQMFEDEAGRRHVKLAQHYDQRVNGALLDPRQLERVVINLVKNAIEAAPDQQGMVQVRTFRPGRGRVELVVEDNGPGIAVEARRNLFVPYFTTKPGGTGIGLALVRQIVLGHGGVVTAEDRPGGGTVMRVVLPTAGGEIA